jgi:uncharacterized membrane protein YdbT with pleckstrin-like domain
LLPCIQPAVAVGSLEAGRAGGMKYIDRVIGPNEEVVYETGLHWIVLVAPLVMLAIATCFATRLNPGVIKTPAAGIFLFAFGAVGLFSFLKALVIWATTEITVTTQRIVFKRGWIARDTIEINFNRIESLYVKQTILGRILNFGTVIVHGTGIGVQPMRDVTAPIELRNAAFGDSK